MSLKELKELAERATPGDWIKGYWSGQCHMKHCHSPSVCNYEYTLREDESCVAVKPNVTLIGYDDYGPILTEDDAKFIAAANPQTVLTLIERIEKLRAALELGANIDKKQLLEMDILTGAVSMSDELKNRFIKALAEDDKAGGTK